MSINLIKNKLECINFKNKEVLIIKTLRQGVPFNFDSFFKCINTSSNYVNNAA